MSVENAEQGFLVGCLDEDAGLLLGFRPPGSDADRGSNPPVRTTEGADVGPQKVQLRLGVPNHPGLTLLGVAYHESGANLSTRLGELADRIDKLG